MDIKRLKNPYFYVFMVSSILSALRIDPQTLTSWEALYNTLQNVWQSPLMLYIAITTIVGCWANFTTKGIKDPKETKVKNLNEVGEKHE